MPSVFKMRVLIIIIQSYLIGLWFSLRTHASQIWQNPQELMHKIEMGAPGAPGTHPHRVSVFQGSKGLPSSLSRKRSIVAPSEIDADLLAQTPIPRAHEHASSTSRPVSPVIGRRVSYAPHTAATTGVATTPGLLPVLDTVDSAVKAGLQPIHLPESMTTEEFTRAVAVATVSALRHQQHYAHSPARARAPGAVVGAEVDAAAAVGGGHGGHDAPSWSRFTSASVLLICTALYAMIAGTFLFFLFLFK
jgi:Ca2+:H+ antiporter